MYLNDNQVTRLFQLSVGLNALVAEVVGGSVQPQPPTGANDPNQGRTYDPNATPATPPVVTPPDNSARDGAGGSVYRVKLFANPDDSTLQNGDKVYVNNSNVVWFVIPAGASDTPDHYEPTLIWSLLRTVTK